MLIIYLLALAADFLAGTAVGMMKNKEGFVTSKGQRIFIILPVHVLLLGMLYNLSRYAADYPDTHLQIVNGLVDVLGYAAMVFFFYVMGINLVSFMKNLSLLGLLPKRVSAFFESYVDTHKNLKQEKTEDEHTAGYP